MAIPDIAQRGLDQDPALKFANVASHLNDQIHIEAGVDAKSLALRARRIVVGGAGLIAPGTNWAEDFLTPQTVIQDDDSSATRTSDVIDTLDWGGVMIETINQPSSAAITLGRIRVYEFTDTVAEKIIADIPISTDQPPHTEFLPLKARRHVFQFSPGSPTTTNPITVNLYRWPPGLPHPLTPTVTRIIGPTTFSVNNTRLFSFLHPLYTRLSITLIPDTSTGTNQHWWVRQTDALASDALIIDQSPQILRATRTLKFITSQLPYSNFRLQLGGTTPTVDLSIRVTALP